MVSGVSLPLKNPTMVRIIFLKMPTDSVESIFSARGAGGVIPAWMVLKSTAGIMGALLRTVCRLTD